MAYENSSPFGTFLASTGLKRYTFVDINSAGVLVKPVTGAFKAIGVLCSSGTTGSTGRAGSTTSGTYQTVQFYGIAKVVSGSSSIAIGDVIKAATDGRAEIASTNSTHYCMGRALAAGASTSTTAEIIPVLLLPGGLYT
jgi:hypothetical protein